VDDRPRQVKYCVSYTPHFLTITPQFYEFGAFQSRTATIEVWGTNSTLSSQELTLDIQYYDLLSNWRSHEEQAVTLFPNQTTELLSKLCPHRGLTDKDIACPSSSVIVQVRLIEPSSKKVVARYSDWPQPLRYIDFPDPELRITRISGTGNESQIEVSVKQPAKCVVLSIREDVQEGSYKDDDKWGESVKWEDNGLDLFPGDQRVMECHSLGKGMEIWAAYMGQEKAFKVV
jgi:beta-mannosidase